MRVNFVVWGTDGSSVPCVCSIRSITEWTTLCMSICIIAARNTRGSASLCEFALVILRCRTDRFSLSFFPVAVCLWNLLPSGVFNGSLL